MKRSAERGFKLVEIMIVVAIIALLAAIAIPNVLRGRTTANESAAIGNLRALISSLEMARSVNQVYPLDLPANTFLLVMYGAGAVPAACAAGIQPAPDFGPPSFCLPLTGPGVNVGLVQGYNYVYAAGVPAGQTYSLIVTPANTGTTGTRSFLATQTGLIQHCLEPTAGAVAATVANMLNDATIDQAPTSPCT